jgi:type IX secretion system PorP/SprF family membrane protein
VKKYFYSNVFIWIALVCLPIFAWAQDIHYTNFGFSPLNINPALTGVFNGDYRATGNFRSQWQGVPVSYLTMSGSFDMKIANQKKGETSPFRVGAFLSRDAAGWSKLNNTSVYLSGSYMKVLTPKDFLSGGISVGFNQRAFKTGDLTWDDQYYEKQFQPTIVTADASVFEQQITYPDVSTGFNYHRQKPGSRSGTDLGLGVFHLNQPKKSFRGEPAVKCEIRYSLTGSTNIMLNNNFDLLLDLMGQFQGPHREIVGGVGARLYVLDKKTKQLAFQLGMTLRNGDALSPHVGILYNNWKFGLNFDSNFSSFKTASNRLGGPEINFIYIFAKAPPAKYCPLCPVYL